MEMQNEEFLSILRQDWLEGADVARIRSLAGDLRLYQVLSCVNVSVPRYKLEAAEGDNEEAEDEEGPRAAARAGRGARTQRMLRLTLFDGADRQLAYEYEPIGAFDSFFDAGANAMARCCAKLALHGRPVLRRGSLWLTSCNVKLLFSGYACRRFAPPDSSSESECLLLIDSDSSPTVTPTQVPPRASPVSPLRISSDIIELANTCFGSGDSEFDLDPVPEAGPDPSLQPGHPDHRPDTSSLGACIPGTAPPSGQYPVEYNRTNPTIYGSNDLFDDSAICTNDPASYSNNRNDTSICTEHTTICTDDTTTLTNKNDSSSCTDDTTTFTNNLTKTNSQKMHLDTSPKQQEHTLAERTQKDGSAGGTGRQETIPDVREYFHPKCTYLEHSFLCFLRRTGLGFGNAAFLQFARNRFSQLLGERAGLGDLCRVLNFGAPARAPDLFFPGPYSDYAFGFLNHAAPVLTGGGGASARLLRAVLARMCLFSDRNVWLAVLDDCLNCRFCLFQLETFPFLRPGQDELATSLELNALEGFFLTEDLVLDDVTDCEENTVTVLRAFLPELPAASMRERASAVDAEFRRIERDFAF